MPHGKICYLEIPANRAEDSARFYSDIFGWKVRKRTGRPTSTPGPISWWTASRSR